MGIVNAIFVFLVFLCQRSKISFLRSCVQGDKTLFEVDAKTGLVTINEIDRDDRKQEMFRFDITAYEKSNNDSNITQSIVVIVEDVNDNSPQITPESLEITIDEETYTTLEFAEPIKIQDRDLASYVSYSNSFISSKL